MLEESKAKKALNLIVFYLFYRWYVKGSVTTRFIVLNSLTTINIIRILAIVNNIGVYLAKPTLEMAKAVTPAMKQAAYSKFAFLALLPYLITIVTYFLFKLDHKITIKKKWLRKKKSLI